jgi:hypothetical protein
MLYKYANDAARPVVASSILLSNNGEPFLMDVVTGVCEDDTPGNVSEFHISILSTCTNCFNSTYWFSVLMSSWFSKILFHGKNSINVCDQCSQKFEKYDELIAHARHFHHHPIVKCHDCGKEFIHEKDRLHHVREEHEKKVDHRTHKWEHVHDKKTDPQGQVDKQTRNFGDNF